MKYDKEVLTINDILTALDNFGNKEEIINAIKRSLYDIETDWHHEEYLRQQLQAYKDKEDKIKKYINAHKTILPLEYSSVDYIDYIADCEPILQILEGDK